MVMRNKSFTLNLQYNKKYNQKELLHHHTLYTRYMIHYCLTIYHNSHGKKYYNKTHKFLEIRWWNDTVYKLMCTSIWVQAFRI